MAGFSIQPNSYMVPWGADMFRGIPGSMNIQMNQGIADIQARQMMWNVPAFGFGFNAYPSMPMTGLEGLLNPAYTWNQVNWNNAANGGFGNIGMGGFGGGVGAFGGNFNGFGMTSPFTSPFGGSSSTSGSSSTDPDTRRYNRLLNILKKMDNYVQNDPSAHILTEAQRDRLHELATKGSSEKEMRDKYKELKTFFDSISKDDKLKFLEFGSIKLSINGKDNGASLYDALVNSGFEYSDTAIDKADLAGDVNAKLKAISKEDFNLASVLDDVKSYKALDFLSSYYSKYKAGSSDDIIDLFFKAVDKAPKDSRDCVKADFKVLITALINQATDIANEIGDPSKEEILKIADNLNKAYDKFDKNDIKKYFKQLYVAARVGAAKNLELSLKEAYGDIDSSLFGYNSFITKGMEDDLTKEGFSNEYSSMNSKIKATSKSDASDSTKKSDNKEDTTANSAGDDSKAEWDESAISNALPGVYTTLAGANTKDQGGNNALIEAINGLDGICESLKNSAQTMGYSEDTVNKATKTLKNYLCSALKSCYCFTTDYSWDFKSGKWYNTIPFVDAATVAEGNGFTYKNEITGKNETVNKGHVSINIRNTLSELQYNDVSDKKAESGIYIMIDPWGTDDYKVFLNNATIIKLFKKFLEAQ